MGTCETVNRKKLEPAKVYSLYLGNEDDKNDIQVVIKERSEKIDTKDFYDIIVPIQSIKDISKGWEIKLSDRFKNNYQKLINEEALRIGIIGNSNKGKSFFLSKLSKMDLPSGSSIKTEGLSIKYPDLKEYPNRRIVLLDSAGLETPVLLNNDLNFGKFPNGNSKQNMDNEEKMLSDYFKNKSREKIVTELFLQDYIIYNSDILIIVVGILTYSEQKTLNKIKAKLKKEKSKIKPNLFIIHNLMNFTSIKQVETYIKETLLRCSTFQLVEERQVNTQKVDQNVVSFYEKNSEQKINHLIFANEYSEAGKYYNKNTLEYIEKLYKSNKNVTGFDVVKTIKERFIQESKDYFEFPSKEKIEFFDKPDTLIKLKSPRELTIKKLFIDELGIQNMKSSGFEPNYSYYITESAIIINVEIPGIFNLESYSQSIGEYNTIIIFGSKINDLNIPRGNNLFNSGREFGEFSLEIPIRLEGYVIKNEKPSYMKNDGIISVIYKIEKHIQPTPFIHEKIVLQQK